jgi:single-strand DNA-binding protein
MNDLNSVLLEGTLTNVPELSRDRRGVPHCLLVIASERYLKQENGIEKRTTTMNIHMEGKMAEQYVKLCHQGRKIRVVGCLQNLKGKNEEGRDVAQVVIHAEHMEVRPELPVKQEKEQSHDFFTW